MMIAFDEVELPREITGELMCSGDWGATITPAGQSELEWSNLNSPDVFAHEASLEKQKGGACALFQTGF